MSASGHHNAATGLLLRAARKLGADELCSCLGITEAALRAMLAGSEPISDDVLLRAMDLLLEDYRPRNAPAGGTKSSPPSG